MNLKIDKYEGRKGNATSGYVTSSNVTTGEETSGNVTLRISLILLTLMIDSFLPLYAN